MASADEREIRDAVVLRLRELMPGARIIHEVNISGTGSNRIDVAAIGRQAIVGVEIKSKRDTLSRLDEQFTAFERCCHRVIVAAHEKHFREHRYPGLAEWLKGDIDLDHPLFFGNFARRNLVWRFPRPEEVAWRKPWTFDLKDLQNQPKAASMLFMLWAEELRIESARHNLPSKRHLTIPQLIRNMVWEMTGRQICEAVCRRLRARNFAEADAPIEEAV